MNDAGEVLLTLYERTIRTGAAAEDAVNAIFGLSVEEQVGPSLRAQVLHFLKKLLRKGGSKSATCTWNQNCQSHFVVPNSSLSCAEHA